MKKTLADLIYHLSFDSMTLVDVVRGLGVSFDEAATLLGEGIALDKIRKLPTPFLGAAYYALTIDVPKVENITLSAENDRLRAALRDMLAVSLKCDDREWARAVADTFPNLKGKGPCDVAKAALEGGAQ